MLGRATLIPLMMIITVVFLALIAIMSMGSNDADIVTDDRYPHYVCTMNAYCIGETCDRSGDLHFVAYLEYEDGNPRLEFPGMPTRVQMTETEERYFFTSTGGEIYGDLSIFKDGGLDLVAFSGDVGNPEEVYASGRCGELRTP